MDKNFKINSKSLLAVEGKDECNFFEALLKYLLIKDVQWVDIGGKDQFSDGLNALYNLEGFRSIERLGFVRDAETGIAESAFQSICGILGKLNLPFPSKLNEIKVQGSMRVGIYIMPDNSGSGMLENLCLQSIKDEPITGCIDSYIHCFSSHIPDIEKSKYNDPKARVQAYLASRAPIVNSLGLAAKREFWNFKHPGFDDIKNFIQSLFKL